MGPRDLLSFDRRARRYFTLGLAFASVGSISLVAWTLLLARTIQLLIDGRPIATEVIGLAALIAVRVAARSAASHLLVRSNNSVQSSLRQALARSWITRSDSGRVRSAAGVESTLMGSGIDALHDYITSFLPARHLAAVIPVLVLIVIGLLDPWTLLILLFAGPMLLLLLAVIGSRTRTLADRRFRELGWLRSFYLDMVRGLPTLKVFHRAEESVETIETLSERFGRTTMDVLRTAFQTSLVIEWAATAATALVAVQVSFRMIEGQMGYASALAVLMLTPEFFAPLRTLAVDYHAGQTGNAVLANLTELSIVPGGQENGTPPTPSRHMTVSPIGPLVGSIVFEDVSHTHEGSMSPSISDLSFTVAPGETIALVGPSGSGKTTILQLLAGRMQPTGGRITVGGRPLSEFSPTDWLGAITSVPQDPFLFRTSIRRNLEIADAGASDETIATALRLALADEFVDALPHGIETELGEEGRTLSGGQRQRIAIARSLLRDAPLMLLDEFTAHLDPETEEALIESLRPFLARRTVVMAAHRPATIALADRVISIGADHTAGMER